LKKVFSSQHSAFSHGVANDQQPTTAFGGFLNFSRREWLQMALCAGAGSLSSRPSLAQAADTVPHAAGAMRHLARYVDPLPVPEVIRPKGPVEVTMREFSRKVHRDLPPSRMWGYNGTWPGPTFETRRGQPITVKWTNQLPTKHFLPIDHTIHGAEESLPEVRTITHVHGLKVLPEHDGYPEAWSTADGKTGPTYSRNASQYPNEQPASTFWYHDHALGITRLNVYTGLAGMYLIRDEEEDALNLPKGRYDIPLLIQDRSFAADGSLVYPPAPQGTHPMWMQEFFGETICVNGKATPYLGVEPRKYRFRLVNGSNARFYHLTMVPSDKAGKPTGRAVDAPAFNQIGSDAGLIPAPQAFHYLIVSPGERFDVVIDFSEHAGKTFAITNDAPAPYTRGGEVVATDVMQFRVSKPLLGKDTSSLPETLVPFVPLNVADAVQERVLDLTEMDRPSDGYTMIGLLGRKHWCDPITENPKAGSTEIWSFANTTGDVHPIHTHLVRFQVINRQAFDVQQYLQNNKLVMMGNPMPPERNERPAWKDTVKTYPGYLTRVIQRFDLPSGTQAAPGQEFRYVWHCHVLEHEDNEMMRPYNVVG
jgi:spore coat protein A, manganese oxidase